MLNPPELTRQRIENYLAALQPRLWEPTVALDAAVYRPDGDEGPTPRDYRALRIAPGEAAGYSYTPIAPGYAWGPVYSDAWFLLTGTVPAAWAGRTVAARLDVGAEAIVWEGDNPLQGIDESHDAIPLFDNARGGETVSLHILANGGNPFVSGSVVSDLNRPQEPSPTPFTFRRAELACYDPDLFGLYYDVKMAYEVMREQPNDSPRRAELLAALDALVTTCDAADRASIAAARARLGEVYARPADAAAPQISAVGYAPIAAGLCLLERAQYRCLHTFATALRLMDAYPEYKFAATQAAQYEWVKHLAPKLYARIKEKVKTGSWEIAGSLWVEADCNLIGSESLVRQILLGKTFFRDEFGVETKDLWLPDGAGSAALPQILKKAGIDYCLTQNLRANPTGSFPPPSFLWQGIDGAQVFTHTPPADMYNAAMTPKVLADSVKNVREPDRAPRSLILFGDGGEGGPTVEMLENARRVQNVAGMPVITLEKAGDFFRKAESDAKVLADKSALAGARELPVWVGELDTEPRGRTYTALAQNKRANRKTEFLLRDVEFLSVISPHGLGAYPTEALDRAWKTTLLNQSRAILSGSGPTEVYRNSAQDYAAVSEMLLDFQADATDALAGAINTTGLRRPVLVVSGLSHFANEAVTVALQPGEAPVAAVGPEGDAMPVQIMDAGGERNALFIAKNVPLHGYAVWDLGATRIAPELDDEVTASPTHLENNALRVDFDPATGLIVALYDKESERDVLNPTYELNADGAPVGPLNLAQCANQLQMFEDKPPLLEASHEALNRAVFDRKPGRTLTELDGVEVVEAGPVRGALRFTRTFGSSKIVQTVRLTAGGSRLDFVTEVEWQETDKGLQAAFPVAINSPRATYEIQFGHVERPTHSNTGWDRAHGEVGAQKWADLSEGNYGVALLNDSKYGHDVHGQTLRLTLLRACQPPAPNADRGPHVFTYALLPHAEDFRGGEVVENAYALNSPPVAHAMTGNQRGSLPLQRSFFEIDNAGVFIEAIKKAEREEAVIVRLYETHNTRGTVTLTTTLPVLRAYLCDLLEKNVVELPLSGGEVTLPIQPFEIVTVKFLT